MKRHPLTGFLVAILLALIVSVPAQLHAQCGVERWSVKTGTDLDATFVDMSSPIPSTIWTMRSWPAPHPIPPNGRVQPYETTVWVVDAILAEFKIEDDSDYHLVLRDASGNTMITEIPSPGCVESSSPFAADIAHARSTFDAVYQATNQFQMADVPVRVTGVGMFDFIHGQTGVAANGIEVHPVLNIVFNPVPCVGDCDGDAFLTVDELVTMVTIALGSASVSDCQVGDKNRDGQITVNEILAAVHNALDGCFPIPPKATSTPTRTSTPFVPPVSTPTPLANCRERTTCCRVCTRGIACGDSCIAATDKCYKGVGCACNAANICPERLCIRRENSPGTAKPVRGPARNPPLQRHRTI